MGGEILGLLALIAVGAIGFAWVRSYNNNPGRGDAGSPGDGGAGYWPGNDSSPRDTDREGGSWFSGLFGSSEVSSHESGSSSDIGGSSDSGGGGGDGGA